MGSVDKPSLGETIERIDLRDEVLESVKEVKNKFLTRGAFLDAAGRLAEKELDVPGLGWVIASELTADERAEVIGKQATALNSRNELDVKSYQRSMLLYGLVDPESPPGNRKKMLRPADVEQMMRIGGGKLQVILDAIEKLSAMGRHTELAEGNSEPTLNGVPTSE